MDDDVADGVNLVDHVVDDGGVEVLRLVICLVEPDLRGLDEQFHLEVVLPDHVHHPLLILVADDDGELQGLEKQRSIIDEHEGCVESLVVDIVVVAVKEYQHQ